MAAAEAYLAEHRRVITADALAMANDLNRQWPNLIGNEWRATREQLEDSPYMKRGRRRGRVAVE